MLSLLGRRAIARTGRRAFATSAFPPPRLFDYETVTKNLTVGDAIESVEQAFKALAEGKVDVPLPMHIGIEESSVAGPGDCHIKGGCEFGICFDVKSLEHARVILMLHSLWQTSPRHRHSQ